MKSMARRLPALSGRGGTWEERDREGAMFERLLAGRKLNRAVTSARGQGADAVRVRV